MGMGRTMAGASAVGAVIGGAAGVRHAAGIQAWKDQISGADLAQLREGRPLPPIPEPVITHRKQHGMIWCYLVGIPLGGFVTWLLTFLILLVLTTMTEGSVSEKILSSQFIAFAVGLCGFVVPGLFIGMALWLREARGRMVESGQFERSFYWTSREIVRGRLDRGEWTAEQAWRHISSGTMGTDADVPPPLPGRAGLGVGGVPQAPPGLTEPEPLPRPGEPVHPLAVTKVASAVTQLTGGYVRAEEGTGSTPAITQRVLMDAQCPERSHIRAISEHNVFEGTVALGWVEDQADRGDEYSKRVAVYSQRDSIDPRDSQAITMLASAIGAYRRACANGTA